MAKLFVGLTTLLACASLTWGQALTQVTGVVTDPTGAVIPGTTLILENYETGARRQTTSDRSGNYAFVQIQPGRYKITGKASGFNDVIVNDIRLSCLGNPTASSCAGRRST